MKIAMVHCLLSKLALVLSLVVLGTNFITFAAISGQAFKLTLAHAFTEQVAVFVQISITCYDEKKYGNRKPRRTENCRPLLL